MGTAPLRTASLIGQTVGNYQLEGLLGKGGMGEVYLARHPVLQREMAVKVLSSELSHKAELVDRFRFEAQAVNRIGHEAIVQVTDFGTTEDGHSYYVMELLRGQSLRDLLQRRGPLQVTETLEILMPIIEALAEAHAIGIVHRDLKPDNIYLHQTPKGHLQPKVLDFGVAKLLEPTDELPVTTTRTGALLGTPLYMSPEQAAGVPDRIGPRSDIYSLGVVIYQMLTGRPPYVADSFGELLIQHMQAPPASLRDHRPDLPPALDAVLQKAMAKAPADRQPTMLVLGLELGAASEEPILAGGLAATVPASVAMAPTVAAADKPAPTVSTAPTSPGSQRVIIGLAILAALAVLGTAAWIGLQGRDRKSASMSSRNAAAKTASSSPRPIPTMDTPQPNQPSPTLAAMAVMAVKAVKAVTLTPRPTPMRRGSPAKRPRARPAARHRSAKATKPRARAANTARRTAPKSRKPNEELARKLYRKGTSAWRARDYRSAYNYADRALRQWRQKAYVLLKGASSCRLQRPAAASWAYNILSGRRRAKLVRLCRQSGIRLP